jgi:hypothetical protein
MNLPQHIGGRIVWLLLGLAVALWLWTRFGGSNIPLETWLASGKLEVQATRSLLAQDARHQAQASRARKVLRDSLQAILGTARALQAQGQGLAQSARSAEQFREASRVLAKSNEVCLNGLTLCKQRGDSLFHADSLHADSLRAALARVDSALAVGLRVSQCRWLLFACPSRTQALYVGVLAGVVGTVLVRR